MDSRHDRAIFDRVLIVAPSSSSNSLGRALALADVASAVSSDVNVICVDDGPTWTGLSSLTHFVTVANSGAALKQILDTSLEQEGQLLVWVVKPLASSAGLTKPWVRSISKASVSKLTIWFDEDDFDAAIHAGWIRKLRAPSRIRESVLNDLAPWRINLRARWWSKRAALTTTSSKALAERVRLAAPIHVVPHARRAVAWTPPSPAPNLRLGFLGTPVAYKGLHTFETLLRLLPDASLHVFEQTLSAFNLGAEFGHRVVTHPGSTPTAVSDALADVDVVVLPQDQIHEASRYQLPAKLMDAMRHGRPVIASDTPVLREYATSGIQLVSSWDDPEEISAVFAVWRDPEARLEAGRSLAATFAAHHSTEACADGLVRQRSGRLRS